jgi:hypothetical protein
MVTPVTVDHMLLHYRGTEVAVTEGLMSDLLTDISAVRSNIRSMKGLPPDYLSEAKYDKVMVSVRHTRLVARV